MSVGQYILKHPNWKNELEKLRSIMLKTPMEETIKWGAPVYTVQGKTVKIEKKPLVIPDELKEALSQDAELADAFNNLSLGKKRDYAEHIETAKQEATKQKRLGKILPMIKQGIGLNDKYKNC